MVRVGFGLNLILAEYRNMYIHTLQNYCCGSAHLLKSMPIVGFNVLKYANEVTLFLE